MAELLSQENAWKPPPGSTTIKLYRKLTTPIRISLPTSSLIFFLISFSLLSISLLSLSSEQPTFWFLLSNSIIFFIAAADSNPSKPNPDYYNEYRLMTTRNAITTPTTTDCTVDESGTSEADSEQKSETPLLAIPENEKTTSTSSTDPSLKFRRRRPKSEDAVGCDEMLLRSTTMPNGNEQCGLDDDAAAADHLPDEELNRRIEEFIRKFNREILRQQMKASEEKEM